MDKPFKSLSTDQGRIVKHLVQNYIYVFLSLCVDLNVLQLLNLIYKVYVHVREFTCTCHCKREFINIVRRDRWLVHLVLFVDMNSDSWSICTTTVSRSPTRRVTTSLPASSKTKSWRIITGTIWISTSALGARAIMDFWM